MKKRIKKWVKATKKKIAGVIFAIVGFILILVKAIDYFSHNRALAPGLTLIGLLLVVIGAYLWNGK
ncbi:MAG: hypothetical protein WC533_01680 [Candidatus Pacearchaeota archaeon]